MKYCSHCGKEVVDEAVVCPFCGCKVNSSNSTKILDDDAKKILAIIVKVFMIIGCIATGWTLIPLIWLIPMTVHVFKKLDNNEPISTGVKVCVLLFCNIIAGIILLCMNSDLD